MSDSGFWRDAGDRLAFEMPRVPAADYPAVSKAVATAFSLTPDPATFGAGLDAVVMDFRRGEDVVEMAWDNWTGFSVVAKTLHTEPLVREIGAWLMQSPWAADGGAGA